MIHLRRTLLLAASLCVATMLASPVSADNHASPTIFGQYFAMVVEDPAAVVDAMTRYRNSPTGQKLTTQVTLSASLANGADSATHTVSVFYGPAAEMERNMAIADGSSDRAEFLEAMSDVVTIETENVFSQTHAVWNEEGIGGPGSALMIFGITALDPPRFTAALEEIIASDAAKAFPGNLFAGQIIAMGLTPGTHWVSFMAKDVGTLLSGVETFMASDDFAEYAEDANEFRRVESRTISRAVLTLGGQE